MDPTVTVQADSEAEAMALLRRVCAAVGLEQYGRPMPSIGTGRWMVRARPADGRVSGERG